MHDLAKLLNAFLNLLGHPLHPVSDLLAVTLLFLVLLLFFHLVLHHLTSTLPLSKSSNSLLHLLHPRHNLRTKL